MSMPSKARNVAVTGALWVVVSIFTYLLLKPIWIVPQILPSGLSFLVVPLIVSFGILSISSIARLTIQRKPWKAMATKGLNGLALFTLMSLIFHPGIPVAFRDVFRSLQLTSTDVIYPLQLIILASTGLAVSKELSKIYMKIGLLFIAPCAGILGYGLYTLSYGLSVAWKPFRYASLPLLVGSLVASISVLFGFFKDVKHPSISGLSEWISDGFLRNSFLAFLLASYFLHLRPYILEEVPLVVILEWVTVSLAVAVMYASAKSLSRHFYIDLEFADWKAHNQKVKRLEGETFRKELNIQELFVDRGIKSPLLIHCILSLRDLESSEEKIVEAVRQLVAYRDTQPVWLALPWVKKKIEKENRNARKRIVESLTETIVKDAGA